MIILDLQSIPEAIKELDQLEERVTQMQLRLCSMFEGVDDMVKRKLELVEMQAYHTFLKAQLHETMEYYGLEW